MLEEMRSHFFVNFSLSEIRDIVSATEDLIDRYVTALNVESQYFKVLDIKMAGSMAEETRVWSFDSASFRRGGKKNSTRFPVIEFDFLARLDIGKDLVIETLKSCEGYMKIFTISETSGRSPFLFPSDVKQLFQHKLFRAIERICNCNSVVQLYHGIECIGRKKRNGCPKCKVKRKSGSLAIASVAEFGNTFEKRCDLIFKWESISGSVLAKDVEGNSDDEFSPVEICILVDLLPSYGLHESDYLLSETGSRSLIPKVCSVCEQRKCWRISHSNEETEIIQGISEHHRNVYMALKVFVLLTFRRPDETHSPISSYIIKTVFLYHLANCYDRSITTLGCLRNIFDLLSISFQNRKLCNIFTNHNLLEKYMHRDETFFQECSTSFEIIKHIVILADLLGDKNCCVNVIYPYLRNANIMYRSLLLMKEGLGDLQKYISKVQAERLGVEDTVYLTLTNMSQHEKRRPALTEADSSYNDSLPHARGVHINSTYDSSASAGIIARTSKSADVTDNRFGETSLWEPSSHRQSNNDNQDDRKPIGKTGSFRTNIGLLGPLELASSSQQLMGLDQKNFDYLQGRNKNMSSARTMDMTRKSLGQRQTGMSNYNAMHMEDNPIGQVWMNASVYGETRTTHNQTGPERTDISNPKKTDVTDKLFSQMPAKLKNKTNNVKEKKKKEPKWGQSETVASYLCNVM